MIWYGIWFDISYHIMSFYIILYYIILYYIILYYIILYYIILYYIILYYIILLRALLNNLTRKWKEKSVQCRLCKIGDILLPNALLSYICFTESTVRGNVQVGFIKFQNYLKGRQVLELIIVIRTLSHSDCYKTFHRV